MRKLKISTMTAISVLFLVAVLSSCEFTAKKEGEVVKIKMGSITD